MNIPAKSPHFRHVTEELRLLRIFPAHKQIVLEISYILPEIPAHVGDFRHIPHTL